MHKWNTCRRWTGLIACVSFGLLLAIEVFAADFTIAWDANDEDNVSGYGVYFRNETSGTPYQWIADVYADELADPQNPMFTVTEFTEDGIYYLSVTAFNDEEAESDRSKAVCVEISGTSVTDCTASIGSSGGSSGGGGGCFVSSAGKDCRLLRILGLFGLLGVF